MFLPKAVFRAEVEAINNDKGLYNVGKIINVTEKSVNIRFSRRNGTFGWHKHPHDSEPSLLSELIDQTVRIVTI